MGGSVITRTAESIEWVPSSAENFTGRAWFGAMAEPERDGGLTVLGVLFEPAARTNWHFHPDGQVLYVVSGSGYVQSEDGRTERVGPGDTVQTPAGDVHWHGAAGDSFLVHLSLTTGSATEWLPRSVTQAEFERAQA